MENYNNTEIENGKICTKCGIKKPFSEFDKDKTKADGYYSSCKLCRKSLSQINQSKNKERNKNYRAKNKEILNEKNRQYYNDNKSIINEKRKIAYREKHRDERLNYAKEYRIKNKQKICKIERERYNENPEKYRQKSKNYRLKNLDKVKSYQKNYNTLNREKRNAASREYYRNHKEASRKRNSIRFKRLTKEDPKYRLRRRMTDGIYRSLKNKNGYSWEKLVGYTFQDLVNHLEKQFKPGMSWDNFGKWHVDHIIPQSVFNYDDFTNIDFKRCWALDNLQPLWAHDNLIKGCKLDSPFQPSLKLRITNK